jgi:hypothetical protein
MKSLPPRLRRTSSSSAPWIFYRGSFCLPRGREPEDHSFITFDEWTCTSGATADGKQSPGQLTPFESESRVRTFVRATSTESFRWALAFSKKISRIVVGSKQDFRFRR